MILTADMINFSLKELLSFFKQHPWFETNISRFYRTVNVSNEFNNSAGISLNNIDINFNSDDDIINNNKFLNETIKIKIEQYKIFAKYNNIYIDSLFDLNRNKVIFLKNNLLIENSNINSKYYLSSLIDDNKEAYTTAAKVNTLNTLYKDNNFYNIKQLENLFDNLIFL